MVKINKNEVLLSKQELFAVITAAVAYDIDKSGMRERNPKLAEFIEETYITICDFMDKHIWEGKKLPEKYIRRPLAFAENETEIAETEEDKLLFHEDRKAICALLLAMLQKTRAYHDLKDLKYNSFDGTVAEFESGGKRQINTVGDSGIAMINDILAHL